MLCFYPSDTSQIERMKRTVEDLEFDVQQKSKVSISMAVEKEVY